MKKDEFREKLLSFEKKLFRFLFGVDLDDENDDFPICGEDDDDIPCQPDTDVGTGDDVIEKAPPTITIHRMNGLDETIDGVPAFLINYNERFAEERPIMFRDEEVRQVISCLIGKFKSNALLVGAAGVGKTKIAEEVARMIASDDPEIPPQLKGYTIWELSASDIVSGSGLVGAVERKAKQVVDFVSNKDNKAILFIDEIHMLMGSNKCYNQIAQIFKPALARGSMKLIGATTLQEVGSFMNDPAFNRRFSRIMVDELTKEQTKSVLCDLRETLTVHYGGKAQISESAVDAIVDLADEYRTAGSHRPDNALTLLDRSMADAFMDAAVGINADACSKVVLTPERIKQTALKIMTGGKRSERIDTDGLRRSLETAIKGQNDVICSVIDSLKRDSLDIFPHSKPLTFLFAGSSGTGKTETARIIANELSGESPIILNMTEFSDDASVNRIVGSPAGYVGSDSGAELPFDILESNPRKVIVLDEFEKCSNKVRRLFMNVFDEGFMQTAKGRTVDFSKTVIIATTNAGYCPGNAPIGFGKAGDNLPSVKDMSGYFDTELLNRFTKILYFHSISEELFRCIVKDRYARDVHDIKHRRHTRAELPDELSERDTDRLVKTNYTSEFGARPVSRVIRAYIEDTILAADENTESSL